MKNLLWVFLSILVSYGCSSSSDSPDETPNEIETRSFYMGFTPWLYEASLDAQSVTYDRLAQHGDIIKHHLLGGVPWQEALDGSPYSSNLEDNIQGRLSNSAPSLKVFLAIDSLNTARDGLAPYWGQTDNLPLPTEWASRTWSSPEVITAYTNYASDMIDRFQPDYFEYGTEASELLLNDLAGFADFVVFAETVYSNLKAQYPNLILITSVAYKSPSSTAMQTINNQYTALMPYTDLLGVSTYPYVFFDHNDRGDPANLPNNWLNQVNTLRGNKPWAISETGWIGEGLSIPEFNYSESSDPTKQNAYLEALLNQSNALNAEFVIWWTVADFDTLWTDTLNQDPLAKIWKDIGLYDGMQNQRTGLSTWNQWLTRIKN